MVVGLEAREVECNRDGDVAVSVMMSSEILTEDRGMVSFVRV